VDFRDAHAALEGGRSLVDSPAHPKPLGDAGDGSAGEGDPAEDVAAGMSLTRDGLGTDTDNNAADFRASTPTPGTMAAASIPEPPMVSLLLLGTALALRRSP